jgi:phosphotransferase system HPr (HPr) family protein
MSESSERTVVLPADLHARPAGQLSRMAAGFDSAVTLAYGGREVDARSVLMVMGLGATKGTELTVRALGPDAGEAIRDLTDLLGAIAPVEPPTASA